MKFNRFLRALLAGVPCLAWAGGAPVVEARIKLISPTRQLTGVGIIRDKTALHFVIPSEMFSEEIPYRGPARFELIELIAMAKPTETRPAGKAGKNAPESARPKAPDYDASQSSISYVSAGRPPLAWTNLPTNQGALNLILLVTPGKGSGITVLRDAPGLFPPGSNRYLNLCGCPVTVKTPFGEQTIPPGGSKVTRLGAKNDEYYELQIMTRVHDGSHLAFSSRVLHRESVRKLYVLTPVQGDDARLLVREIEDRQPSKGAPPIDATARPFAR